MLSQLLLFILVLPYWATCEDYIEATADSFDSIINNNDLILVKFYAEWCGHCKRMAPEFAKAATELKNNIHPVTLVKVNCPNHQPLCEKYKVTGYPTLKIFNRGDLQFPREYNGPREANGIIKYMKSQAGPDSNLIENEHDIEKLIASTTGSVFVASVGHETDPMFNSFEMLAKEFRERFTFGHMFGQRKNSIRRYLPKVIQTKLEPQFEEISTSSSHDILRNWLLENWGGLVSWHPDQANMEAEDLMGNPKSKALPRLTVFYDCDYERDPKGSNYIRNRILKVAKKLKDGDEQGVKFFMASAPKNEKLLESTYNLQWKKGDKPVVVGHFMSNKYVMREEFNYDELEKWAKLLAVGGLEPYLKSEDIPESQPDEVVKVVARTFDQVVRDQGKYVLIEFFAPWCGHCKNLKPIYEELAGKVKSKSDLVIAAMDATANDVPKDFAVSGFPTIYWVNKKNEISTYNGGRTVKDFLKFIESNTDHKFAHDEL